MPDRINASSLGGGLRPRYYYDPERGSFYNHAARDVRVTRLDIRELLTHPRTRGDFRIDDNNRVYFRDHPVGWTAGDPLPERLKRRDTNAIEGVPPSGYHIEVSERSGYSLAAMWEDKGVVYALYAGPEGQVFVVGARR